MRLFDLFLASLCVIMLVLLVAVHGQSTTGLGIRGQGHGRWNDEIHFLDYPIYVPNSKDKNVHDWFTRLLAAITLTLATSAFLTRRGGNVNTYQNGGMESMNGGLPPPS